MKARIAFVHQFALGSGKWETVTDDCENPVIYRTLDDAQRDLRQHLATLALAVQRGDMADYCADDWRIRYQSIYETTGFGDTLEFAESLGWVDSNIEPWDDNAADATEASALRFIESKGFVILEGLTP